MIAAHPTPDYSIAAMRAWKKLPEDICAEVIYGKLYILPTPSIHHERVIMRIANTLYNYVEEHGIGEVFAHKPGVFLIEGKNAVEPDIVFVSNTNPFLQVVRKGVFGPSDLHIEVLSSSNRKHDLVRKKKLYEEAGVREYWIIDPENKEARGYLLENGRYDEPLIMNSEIHVRTLDKHITF